MDIDKNVTKAPSNRLFLLLALDGSRMAESVLPIVEELSNFCFLELLLLHVIEKNAPTSVHGERHITTVQQAQTYLENIAARFANKKAIVHIHVHPNEVGDVAQSIIEHTNEYQPSWVVLSTHGSGGVKELLFGSIAQEVLGHGNCPVLLIPPLIAKADGEVKLRHILLPFDPLHKQDEALLHAAKLAQMFGATLKIVLVVPKPDSLYDERALAQRFMPNAIQAILEINEEQEKEQLNKIASSDILKYIEVTTQVIRGDILPQLVNTINQEKVDLVVIASHAEHGFGALVKGSLVPRLIKQTKKPILLIRLEHT